MRSIAAICLCSTLLAATSNAGAQPALTIYNQNFAVVRDTLPLELKAGINRVTATDTTAQVEPQSVVLRDPSGRRTLQILEQSYNADPLSQGLLLSLYEGKTIEFEVTRGDRVEIVRGKIIRSGYVAGQSAARRANYYQPASPEFQPVIEVDGKLRFDMPGRPLFPSLPADTVLKPTLNWLIETNQPGQVNAELSYVTGGMSWATDYNVVSPETGDTIDLTGWVTLNNQSGKSFENARIKLMAGDVSRVQQDSNARFDRGIGGMVGAMSNQPAVTEKTFDEYHLYSLQRPSTLRDKEIKQVEFVRATGVKSRRIYVYEGARIDPSRRGYSIDSIRQDREYGTQSNPKVWAMREVDNTTANGLGMPLPQGKLRFYRRDTGGLLEFIGENVIDHTPQGETLRVFTGNAFDIVGERRRTEYNIDHSRRTVDESFEIKLRNRKKEPVEVRVVERLYRGLTWELTAKSDTYLKLDSQLIEFRVPVKPDEERTITYSVRYTW